MIRSRTASPPVHSERLVPLQTPEFELGLCLRGLPFRPLNWRWQAAKGLLNAPCVPWVLYDAKVRAARKLVRKLFACTAEEEGFFWKEHPDLLEAHNLSQLSCRERYVLEAWLLSGTPLSEVAERVGRSTDMVAIYKNLFFDAEWRGQRYFLDIVFRRIAPGQSEESLAGQVLKSAAWACGPAKLEEFLMADEEQLVPLYHKAFPRLQKLIEPVAN